MTEEMMVTGPTLPSERIVALDALRGFALLGILFANIQISAMIKIAEFNPNAFGDLTGINYVVAMVTNIVVSRKFFLLFAMLFGAGIVLISEKIESKGERSFRVHFPRMFWLFILGSLNFYLLAPGEILAYYAVGGIFAWFFRKLSPKKLLIYGLVMLALGSIFDGLWQYSMTYISEKQKETLSRYYWAPDQKMIDEEVKRNQGPWTEWVVHKVETRKWFMNKNFYIYDIWNFLGKFLLGMALFKWGVLTGRASDRTYRILLLFGTLAGLPVVILGWVLNDLTHWSFEFSLFAGGWFNQWGGLVLTLGYIGGLMLLLKNGKLKRISSRLAPFGRMAFTNFIMQSVFCGILFFGWGFGLQGKVERWGQFLMVIGILALQVAYSNWWLNRFRFGPVEWLWRSLAYWEVQPFRKGSS